MGCSGQLDKKMATRMPQPLNMKYFKHSFLILLGASWLLSGCKPGGGDTISLTPGPGNTAATAVPIPASPAPTPTETVVYIASVNGEQIPLSSLVASVSQLEAVQREGGDLLQPGEDAINRALESLIERQLLSQAARLGGFQATPEIVEQRYNRVVDQSGGIEIFTAWLNNNGYTPETFRQELALEIEATWQREQIAAGVPLTADQVRARQVLFKDAYLAARAHNQLLAGASFDTIVANNDPYREGYLDWFPRGYIFFQNIEDAAFSMQPGEFSNVLETKIGFVILEVMERDPARPLSADAHYTLQIAAIQAWLADQRQQSQIDIYAP